LPLAPGIGCHGCVRCYKRRESQCETPPENLKVLRQSFNCLLVNVVLVNMDFQLVCILSSKLYISCCKANIKSRQNPKGNMALIKTMFPGPTISCFQFEHLRLFLECFLRLCLVLSIFMLTSRAIITWLGGAKIVTFWTKNGQTWQACPWSKIIQKSAK